METLRVIVACTGCGSQFDASRRPVGSQFHCTCGEVLVVPPAQAHEAAVVRCSSCGAPRQDGGQACGFCSADFTVHEQDLDTMCPGCFARISRRARYCHKCATPLVVQGEAGAPTEYPCPVCTGSAGNGADGPRLASRRVAGESFAALECGCCAGLFIGNEAFRMLAEGARREQLIRQEHGGSEEPAYARPAKPAQKGSFYRSCPQCGGRMNRQNYGRSSGVIIDICREHGVWFDAEELDQILAWIRRGGLTAETERRSEELKERERAGRFKASTAPVIPAVRTSFDDDSSMDVLAALVSFAGRLFSRAWR